MKLAICSDLHLELEDLQIENTEGADVLVLAGDIFEAVVMKTPSPAEPDPVLTIPGSKKEMAKRYRDFIRRASKEFPHVVAVAGNHEFYDGKWLSTFDILRREYGAYENVHYLEKDAVYLGDIKFVGGTLWTDMNGGDFLTMEFIREKMNDYRLIRHDGHGYTKLRPSHTLQRHRETLDFFKRAITVLPSAQKTVVVTHMAPSFLSADRRYEHETALRSAYCSDLSNFILDFPQISMWIHGHVHTDNDYMIGSCRVISNPRGYVGYERGGQEIEPFYPKVVEV